MKRRPAILSALLLCTACTGLTVLPAPPTPSLPPSPSPAPSPTPEPKKLTICLSEEPDSLYLYGTDSPAAHHIWAGIYDGPIDSRDYVHQPIILTHLPSLDDGTAAVDVTPVEAGDRVLAASGNVMELAPGVIVEDATGERVVFDGAPIAVQQMVVTFTLRPDVRWSDGAPLTGEDSVTSFQLAADPATPMDKHLIERTASYRAIDEQTVTWQGVPGFLDPAYRLNFWHPLPRHDWGSLSAAELLASEVSTRKPLGWGPFAIREWVPGEHVTVERNRFYFRAGDGLPRLDEVTFRFINSPGELAERLASGDCDVVTHEDAAAALAAVEGAALPSSVDSLVTADNAWELLAFAISPAPGHDRPDFFEDVRVRQAIAQCIDRQAIADAVSPTGGPAGSGIMPPEHPLHGNDNLSAWEYDPGAGERLLAQAGWYDEDGDGIHESHGVPGIPDSTPFQVTYHTTEDRIRLRAAELIQADLGRCGIQANLQALPPEELFALEPGGVLFARRFDLAQFSWQTTVFPLCDLFLSSQIPGAGDWSRPNVAGFIDGGYDRACQQALKALPDSADSIAAHADAQRILSEQTPVVPLFRHQRVTLAQGAVTGLLPTPSQRSELWNLEQVDILP